MKTNTHRDPLGAVIFVMACICATIGGVLALVPSCGMMTPSRHHPVTTEQRIFP